jgi:hypothetical protein
MVRGEQSVPSRKSNSGHDPHNCHGGEDLNDGEAVWVPEVHAILPAVRADNTSWHKSLSRAKNGPRTWNFKNTEAWQWHFNFDDSDDEW